jgi:LPS-assembly protein
MTVRCFLLAVLFRGIFAASFFSPVPAAAFSLAEQPESLRLEAGRVRYDDESGTTTAEGDAHLTWGETTIQAERIDYDASTQKVRASSPPGGSVVLRNGGRTLMGDSLEYDLDTGEGLLQGAKSAVPLGSGTLYVFGGGLDVIPWDMARERGLVRGNSLKDAPDLIARWTKVTATTCALDHPHYRIETKSITFIPGRLVVAKRPRLYLGETYLLTWPADYIVEIDRRALRQSVTPYIQSSGSKGTGFGLSGTFGWSTGALDLGLSWWSRVDLEGMAEIEQELGGGWGVRTGVEYSWDKAWREKEWRPWASLFYGWKDWRASVSWRRNEFVEDRKTSLYEYQGRLDRRPEIEIASPWIRDPAVQGSWLRLNAFWGQYREKTLDFSGGWTTRSGAQLQHWFETPAGRNLDFFWNLTGSAWFYRESDDEQRVLDVFGGLRYRLGIFELGTGYQRRYVDGYSPMLWDSFKEAERVHQKIRFPVGREFFLQVRGSYDLNESMIDEVNYALQWINDCMKWELRYLNDRTSGGEDRVSLSVSLLAFPRTPASFGQYEEEDPFLSPDDLPEK